MSFRSGLLRSRRSWPLIGVHLFGERFDASFARTIYRALRCLTDTLGVIRFNLVVYLPPLGPAVAGESWQDFPIVVRMVDRGDPMRRTADFGAMELYAASVVSSDPFKVAETLLACMSDE